MFEFTCNICSERVRVGSAEDLQRDVPSCPSCHSTVRHRWVIYALSQELFGTGIPLKDFPFDRTISGIGLSDQPVYADELARRLGYVNTFYHCEPLLDIRDLTAGEAGANRFVIASDVFEHIIYPIQSAFDNLSRLLAPDGFVLFSVPWRPAGFTVEHFPKLHNWSLSRLGEKHILINETKAGTLQVSGDLVFHGGDGHTLEMRRFAKDDLLENFRIAGLQADFSSIEAPKFGVVFPKPWSLPCVVRRIADGLPAQRNDGGREERAEGGTSELAQSERLIKALYGQIDGLTNWIHEQDKKLAALEQSNAEIRVQRDEALRERESVRERVEQMLQRMEEMRERMEESRRAQEEVRQSFSSQGHALSRLEEERRLIGESRWLKLGRRLGLGPRL